MKKLATALVLIGSLAASRQVQAKPLTLITKLRYFGGYSAYIALYLVDPHGHYVKTLWMAGGYPYYYHHLSDWIRRSRGDYKGLNGITGGSVGAGRTLTVHTNVADALINAGYKIYVDVASQGMWSGAMSVPLTTKDSGKVVHGRTYVSGFEYRL